MHETSMPLALFTANVQRLGLLVGQQAGSQSMYLVFPYFGQLKRAKMNENS